MMEENGVDLHGQAVAIVDDDLAVRDSTRLLLELNGIAVQAYQSGREFLQAIPSVACLILDYHMPGMTGLELVSELRRRGFSAPTIMLTATTDPTIERRAAALGITQILRKPTEIGEIRQTLL